MGFPETNKLLLVVSVFKWAHRLEETPMVDEINIRYFDEIFLGPDGPASGLYDSGDQLDVGGKQVSLLPTVGLGLD
jgi:hypothetical protein